MKKKNLKDIIVLVNLKLLQNKLKIFLLFQNKIEVDRDLMIKRYKKNYFSHQI